MDQPRTARLHIDFELGADPIAGRLHDEHGGGQAFSGWIELTRAIELGLAAACRTPPPKPAGPPQS
jgi:hypothetical protein